MKNLFIICLFFLLACQNRYERFKDLGEQTYVKMIAFGDNEIKAKGSEYLAFKFQFCSNELCMDKEASKIAFAPTQSNPAFWNEFLLGDEFILLLDTGMNESWYDILDLYDKKIFYPLIVKVKLVSIYDKAKYSGPPLLRNLLLEYRENNELDRMIDEILIEDYFEKEDCYLKVVKEGEGDSVTIDRKVVLSYKAYLPDGTKFDDTDLWEDTMSFQYGQPLQVIKGLEIGIQHLRQGSEAKLIIPSHLAFGKDGSSSGIIRPFEPLFYDLKIISVTTSDL